MLVLALVLIPFTAAGQIQRSADTVLTVERKSPAEFQQLPAPFLKQLLKRGCSIPQPYGREDPPDLQSRSRNVIHGHFGSMKQTDWAVVCTLEDKSVLSIYWGGPLKCASDINIETDRKVSSSRARYWREIATATNKSIRDLLREEQSLSHVPIRHDAIWDIYDQKQGSLDYCYRGKWFHHINGGH